MNATKILACVLALAGCTTESEGEQAGMPDDDRGGGERDAGDVYVLDNAAARNAVLRYHRAADGALTPAGEYPTGGRGTGAGLGSQGAVVLTADGSQLFAVNAGSDELSVFDVVGNELVLRDIVPSGGPAPISVTTDGVRVYVVNAGRGDTAGCIAGFTVERGRLTEIAGSNRALSAAQPAPAQIEIAPDGDTVVVTEKGTNSLVTYRLDHAGKPGNPIVTRSAGMTPFGFAFDARGTLVVSEAFGGADNASAVSTYRLVDGVPQVISASVPTGQTAACWVAISGEHAFTTNTGSDSVSGYDLGADGAATRFADGGATAAVGDAPIDLDFARDGELLYVLNGAGDSIDILQRTDEGALQSRGTVTGLPTSAVGIIAD